MNIILFDSIQKLPLTMQLLNVKSLHYQILMLNKVLLQGMHEQSLFFHPYYYLNFQYYNMIILQLHDYVPVIIYKLTTC